MPKKLFIVEDPFSPEWTEVIDVRSPSEYAYDHVPGAISLPVLSDEERKEVGTVYKQISAFRGRKLGAGLIAANIGEMLKSHFSKQAEGYRPLIYCARGGQRSKSLAIILSEIGWEVGQLKGGYKRYRATVRETLSDLACRFEYRVLTGLTGCGKSKLLESLEKHGEQILHLEHAASHQGSILGGMHGVPQPSQKMFESILFRKLFSLDPSRPVWVEAESKKIGDIHLPAALHEKMRASKAVAIMAPLSERVSYTIKQYPHFIADPESLKGLLSNLKELHSKETIALWMSLIDTKRWDALVASLLSVHYDPRYQKALDRNYGENFRTITLKSLSDEDIDEAVPLVRACC